MSIEVCKESGQSIMQRVMRREPCCNVQGEVKYGLEYIYWNY